MVWEITPDMVTNTYAHKNAIHCVTRHCVTRRCVHRARFTNKFDALTVRGAESRRGMPAMGVYEGLYSPQWCLRMILLAAVALILTSLPLNSVHAHSVSNDRPLRLPEVSSPTLDPTILTQGPLRLTASPVSSPVSLVVSEDITPSAARPKPGRTEVSQAQKDQKRRADRLTMASLQDDNDSPEVGQENTGDANAQNSDQNNADPQNIESQNTESQNIGLQDGEDAISDGEALADIQEPVPADYVPPYTDDLGVVQAEPLFKPSQTVSWIVAILVLVFGALLFSWFVRRLVSNALEVEEAASNEIFQATEGQVYRFDDDEEDEAPEEAADLYYSDEDPDGLFGDEESDELFDEPEKKGLMSWLFSGRKRETFDDIHQGDVEDETGGQTDEQGGFIDVDSEPITPITVHQDDLTRPGDHIDDREDEAQIEDHEDTEEEASQRPTIQHTMADNPGAAFQSVNRIAAIEPEFEEDQPAVTPPQAPLRTIAPLTTPTIREPQPSMATPQPAFQPTAPAVPLDESTAEPASSDHNDGADQKSSLLSNQPDYNTDLADMKDRQREISIEIAELKEQMSRQSQKINDDLGTFRTQSNAFQHNINRSLEARFAAISNSVEKGLAQTRQLTDEKFAQVPDMSTEDVEKKIQTLDERFNAQSQAMEVNFSKVLQKLEQVSTPAPQLSQLSTDTTELKTQLSALQKIAQEAPVPVVNAPVVDNTEILTAMKSSLDDNQKLLASWHQDHRTLLSSIERISERIQSLESDLAAQKEQALSTISHPVQEAVAPVMVEEGHQEELETSRTIDPLGLMGSTADPQPAHHANTETAHVLVAPVPTPETPPTNFINGHANGATPPESPFAPVTPSAPAVTQQEDIQAAPAPDDDSPEMEREPEITPIMFDQSSLTRRPAPQQSHAPVAGQSTNATSSEGAEDKKTIRPLTFGFSNFDKTSTTR